MSESIQSLGPKLQERLGELEQTIEAGLHSFQRVGHALLEIRDQHLYTEQDTFEEYCQTRWDISRGHAYRLMDAATINDVLSPTGDTPQNEAQARELAPLKNDEKQLVDTWRTLRQEHGDGLTAGHVRHAVAEALKAGTSAEPAPLPPQPETTTELPPVPKLTGGQLVICPACFAVTALHNQPFNVSLYCANQHPRTARVNLAAAEVGVNDDGEMYATVIGNEDAVTAIQEARAKL